MSSGETTVSESPAIPTTSATTTPTQLGIITNYTGDPLVYSDEHIRNPKKIQLANYFGLTNIKGPEQNVEISEIVDRGQYLKNNFLDKFNIFDKLSNDTDISIRESLPEPWDKKFVKDKLIIIYLEAIKTDAGWNTTTDDNNRIYIFDEQGKEARIRANPSELEREKSSQFYKIIIENNKLKLKKKNGIIIPFLYVPAVSMTLATLISELLGDEIDYNGAGPAEKTRLAGREMKVTGVTGGKKSKRKQRKSGKKSRKQRKSMRKMKRSRSKK